MAMAQFYLAGRLRVHDAAGSVLARGVSAGSITSYWTDGFILIKSLVMGVEFLHENSYADLMLELEKVRKRRQPALAWSRLRQARVLII